MESKKLHRKDDGNVLDIDDENYAPSHGLVRIWEGTKSLQIGDLLMYKERPLKITFITKR